MDRVVFCVLVLLIVASLCVLGCVPFAAPLSRLEFLAGVVGLAIWCVFAALFLLRRDHN